MFCHKCGAQLVEEAVFCPKCGTKVVHTDDTQQPADTSTPMSGPQQTDAAGPTIIEDHQQRPNTNKANGVWRKASNIGRILMWGSLILLFLHLPISPAILVAGAAIGIILSALGSKRPLGLSKIIELVVAVVLLVIIAVSTLSSGGGSTSRGSDSQSSPGLMSDEIMIGETQSYDNDFGNIEVTLDYVAFTDQIENTLLGGYIYPDAGNVFLWAGITVKNIGTENGDLLTAWNTVVYDGAYEFRSYTTVGGPLTSIAPLTAPTEGAIIFEVPTEIMESDKSLVLKINDGSGKAVLSYVIRPGNGATGNDDSSLCYDDRIAVAALLGCSTDQLTATMGNHTQWRSTVDISPFSESDYTCYAYDGITCIINPSWEVVDVIVALPDTLSIYNETLDKNRDELIALLGEPLYEDILPGGVYSMDYGVADTNHGIYYGLSIECPSANEAASRVMVYSWEGPAPGEDGWWQEPEDAGYIQVDLQTLFDELDSNALRANQTYNGTKVKFTGYLGTVDNDGKYISVDASPNSWSFDSISCYFTDPSQLDVIFEKSRGDEVTICGTITDVGELLGYYMNIESIR